MAARATNVPKFFFMLKFAPTNTATTMWQRRSSLQFGALDMPPPCLFLASKRLGFQALPGFDATQIGNKHFTRGDCPSVRFRRFGNAAGTTDAPGHTPDFPSQPAVSGR